MKILVYDHSFSSDPKRYGPLQKLANAHSLDMMEKTVEYVDDINAVEPLLKTDANVFLVHVDPGAWKKLIQGLGESRYAVRFSTETLSLTPKDHLSRGVFHFAKQLGDTTHEEFGAVASLFSSENAEDFESLRRGSIPTRIRGLIRYREPHLLRGLHILLRGILASWTSGTGDQEVRQRAKRCRDILGFGLHEQTPPAPLRIEKIETWRRCLGMPTMPESTADTKAKRAIAEFKAQIAEEIGIRELTELEQDEATKLFGELVSKLAGAAQEEALSEEICVNALSWIKTTLNTQ